MTGHIEALAYARSLLGSASTDDRQPTEPTLVDLSPEARARRLADRARRRGLGHPGPRGDAA